ncbi:MAG TPA: CBS domain-containing protein [Rhodospirillales bacterium]|nr:CBS domain-containing protein [Rhodospirillales bacterium]
MPERPVREILSRDTLVAGPPEMTVREAARRMAEHVCGSILVLDGETLVGIFTERDLLVRVIAAGRDPDATRVAEVMTRSPDTIAAGAPVKEAIRRMDEFGYKHLPVMEGDRVVGVIAVEDIPIGELVGMSEELEERHRLAERMW